MSKAVEAGKVVEFNKNQLSNYGTPITVVMRVGNLYYLDCLTERQQGDAADNQGQQSNEDACNRRYGVQNLQKLAKEELVNDFNFNSLQTVPPYASHSWREVIQKKISGR